MIGNDSFGLVSVKRNKNKINNNNNNVNSTQNWQTSSYVIHGPNFYLEI